MTGEDLSRLSSVVDRHVGVFTVTLVSHTAEVPDSILNRTGLSAVLCPLICALSSSLQSVLTLSTSHRSVL